MVWWHTKDIKISLLLQRVFVEWTGMFILVQRMPSWRQVKIHISLVNSRRDNFVNFGQCVLITRLVSMVWITLLLFILCTLSVLCWIVKFFQIWQSLTLKFLLRSLILLNNNFKKISPNWRDFFIVSRLILSYIFNFLNTSICIELPYPFRVSFIHL